MIFLSDSSWAVAVDLPRVVHFLLDLAETTGAGPACPWQPGSRRRAGSTSPGTDNLLPDASLPHLAPARADKHLETSAWKLKFSPDWDSAADDLNKAAICFKVRFVTPVCTSKVRLPCPVPISS